MWIELRQIRESGKPLDLKRRLDSKELGIDKKIGRLTGPVEVDLSVTAQRDRVHVTGQVQGELEVACCRCLQSVMLKLDRSVDLEYSPDPQVDEEGEEFELEYEDLGTAFYRDDRIDLQSLVNEQFLLQVPMKPVCHVDCRGLCEQCGRDLNQGDCNCRPDTSDPRLAALAALKERMSGNQ